jgi:hypothetical protein
MAKSTAIRFLLLATMRMEKLYQLSLFRRISEKESRLDCDWKYTFTPRWCPSNCP